MNTARVVNGVVVDLMEQPKGRADMWVQDVNEEAEIRCAWSQEDGFHNFPDADLRATVKALVLVVKSLIPVVKTAQPDWEIPPAALAIWQRVKENKL